jgi:hypothetical protein
MEFKPDKNQINFDDLDIENKGLFSNFLLERKKWLFWFSGEPDHSLSAQIYRMLWDDAIFRLTNEMRRVKITSPDETTAINGDLAHFIDRGYVNLQATSIRSLIDNRNDVISLTRIIKDLKKNVGLITRENYVCYDGVKYSSKENDFGECMGYYRQKAFDKLCGNKNNARNRNDLIDLSIFSKLLDELSSCQDVKIFTNKFIAHKADSTSLKSLEDEQRGITLDQIHNYHKIILRVGNFIYGTLLGESELGGIPTPQYDICEDFDKPWISSKGLEGLGEFWNSYVEKLDNIPPFEP